MKPKHIIIALVSVCFMLPVSAQNTWKYKERGIKTRIESLSGSKVKTTEDSGKATANSKTATKDSRPSAESKSKEQLTGRFTGMKTNIAYYAGAVANLGVEVQLSRHFSLDMPVNLSLWDMTLQHGLRLVLFQPEARYWFGNAGNGHFLGIHAHVAGFNVKWEDTRYQSKDLPLLGAGLSYGYSLRMSDHWNFEFTLGAGYAYIRYDTFYNIDNGAQTGSGIYNYFGLTKLGLSLVYSF